MNPQSFSQAFDRAVGSAGLPRVTPHGLRHGHGTLAMQAGVNTKIVQERLGHYDPSFTARIYQHVQPGMQADAAQ